MPPHAAGWTRCGPPPHTHFRPSNTSPPTPKRPPLTARVPRRRRSQRARSSGRALHLLARRQARGAAGSPLVAGAAGAPARRQPHARISTRRRRRTRESSYISACACRSSAVAVRLSAGLRERVRRGRVLENSTVESFFFSRFLSFPVGAICWPNGVKIVCSPHKRAPQPRPTPQNGGSAGGSRIAA